MKFTLSQVRRLNLFVATGVSSAYIFGKTFYAKNLRDDLEIKENNKAVPVPPKIKRLVNEVLEDMKMDQNDRLKIEPFMCKNNDIRHVGFSVLGFGAFLGIPQNFVFDVNNPVDFFVEVDGKRIPKNSPEFEDLRRVMCLSDEAKKFAIAQEIYLSQHKDIVPCGILPLTIVIKSNIMSYILDKLTQMNVNKYPRRQHYIIFIMGAWLYVLLYDILSVFGETESDYQATELGDSYVAGGLEYYSKMVERNKILKKLNKKAPYNEDGDKVTSYIRTNHMPFTRRIIYLDNMIQGNKKSIWNYVFYMG